MCNCWVHRLIKDYKKAKQIKQCIKDDMYYHALLKLPNGKTEWFYNRTSLSDYEKEGKIIKHYRGGREYGYC